MSHLSLASRYRPQRFCDVAGQPLAAKALSRAAEQDKVAPAYLLSGTRGIGKTTIARIFAKALNCEHAPGPEPCNECAQCKHVTAGNHVDVSEIDGASNTGVDDVRALRETIGFVPMEGRYKIFIVDEAHMLSKSAFNALLKTLEEPPGHTVFIFATTEAHKFPATIISRCQHFVFRHLPEQAIYDHLAKILKMENVDFEEGAVRLVARRAQGSVRDSLSLMDQVLAINPGKLEAEAARETLGVAGHDLQAQLLQAIAGQDCGKIIDLTGSLLSSGLDLGFFSRELAILWRNLFLMRQTGKILPGLPADESEFLKLHAPAFEVSHLHSAWQMTLESQRGISQSPEPGAALELLLLNIALLPRLLPVGSPAMPKPAGLSEQAAPVYESKAPEKKAAPESGQPIAEKPQDASQEAAPEERIKLDWRGFCEFCQAERKSGNMDAPGVDLLNLANCDWQADRLVIRPLSTSQSQKLQKNIPLLAEYINRYCGEKAPAVEFEQAEEAGSSQQSGPVDLSDKPELRLCQEILGAEITECKLKPGAKDAEHE